MGMSQTSISPPGGPSGGPFEGPYDVPNQRPPGAVHLAEAVVPAAGGEGEDAELPEERYLDREESWLRFN